MAAELATPEAMTFIVKYGTRIEECSSGAKNIMQQDPTCISQTTDETDIVATGVPMNSTCSLQVMDANSESDEDVDSQHSSCTLRARFVGQGYKQFKPRNEATKWGLERL